MNRPDERRGRFVCHLNDCDDCFVAVVVAAVVVVVAVAVDGQRGYECDFAVVVVGVVARLGTMIVVLVC